ncbi:hypothetical protein LPJ64_003511 [Coemansia asiatica]|uniref:RING-type domain-containing protein n=1 Tax=Coemansia asiatica TaxID=1052880 RepID=A0A9W7XK48_9FUNG|nr:hypothetical protein LPJ64_003511 [Coemansia asiatica]KAJ2888083.1 hypothetical protein FB639_000889 [Coemansia asiatica]
MVRHSKNNTASGVFTYAERQMVDYGTKSRRLGRDSKLDFDSCYLCLSTARSPMICALGHLSCKECVLQSILEQKQSIEEDKRQFREHLQKQEKERKQRIKEDEQRVVEDYEKREIGLSRKRSNDDDEANVVKQSKARLLQDKTSSASRALVAVINAESGAKDRKKKKSESSFWVPDNAPSAEPTVSDPNGRSVRCWASSQLKDGHLLKVKHLVSVSFRSMGKDKLCPSCDKAFGNSSKIDVLRPCGHAMCHRCVNNFVLPAGICFVCEKKIDADKDVVRLHSEGTGFSGGGGQMVAERYDHALQA